MVVSLQNSLSEISWLRMSQGRTGKFSTSPGGTETIVWNQCSYQIPAIVGTNYSTKKITSSTTQRCRPFQDEDETEPQRFFSCVLVLLIWYTRLKHRWKMVSVSSSIYGGRPLMCLTKLFYPKLFGSLWGRRKGHQCKRPAHISPEAII